ncbi:MAG: hypothetical protein M5U28_10965 [Sandaracinaceae bacterium]|nr:hypothetical protein [Sandaracinaceae bacterium]
MFDERTESQDLASLEALGALLSRVTSSPAVSVLVHDSDVLDLRLYRDGARVDRYDSFPGYFEGKASKKQKAAAAGHPERWSDLLAGGSVEELRAAWTGEDLFAEGALARTCELIGCDPRRASWAIATPSRRRCRRAPSRCASARASGRRTSSRRRDRRCSSSTPSSRASSRPRSATSCACRTPRATWAAARKASRW